ncbi:hypothetical protein G7Y89_g2968 [Cudoniella acicularis]|uniref:Uncharacterized protein n=1 Tax=Cudoniella acicularis TaxID=354080 RepID=A0A8H4RSC9_9HELO|nr:hypothetical protein G7Y89_g2968 [Cudoniella acicularis]
MNECNRVDTSRDWVTPCNGNPPMPHGLDTPIRRKLCANALAPERNGFWAGPAANESAKPDSPAQRGPRTLRLDAKATISDPALPVPLSKSKRDIQSRRTFSPSRALSHWLELGDASEKQSYFLHIYPKLPRSSLTTELLCQLHESLTLSTLEHSPLVVSEDAQNTLQSEGFTNNDVAEWVWILSGQTSDQMLERFFSTPTKIPMFLLWKIIQKDIQQVRNLKMAVLCVWNRLLCKSEENLANIGNQGLDAELSRSIAITTSSATSSASPSITAHGLFSDLNENSFTRLIGCLLYHARRICPPLMLSISHMVETYMLSILEANSHQEQNLDARMHQKLCRLQNHVIRSLALPSSIDPFKSMVHNWSAQKVVLGIGEKFTPPLLLNEDSYRAVVQVLAASKKSERETKASMLRTRTWPPWRVVQDGMDAQTSPEDNLSRVSIALSQKQNSGYSGAKPIDEALKIVGGQELDGTPTVHTRQLIKSRKNGKHLNSDSLGARQWAARIDATRDVQEAWSAFSEYKSRNGRPTLAMYSAMFIKLNYESARIGRKHTSKTSPGDGREVLLVANENFSNSYRSHLQPPSLDALYDEMIMSGIRPSGRCLTFLLEHASSINHGLRFLRDSRVVNRRTTAYLAGNPDASPSINEIQGIPPLILRGLELDPKGFQLICYGFTKALTASVKMSELQNRKVFDSLHLVKTEFAKMSESVEAPHHIPKILHSISGPHLHAYVRALGVAKDFPGILSVLQWMVSNSEELNQIAIQARNGPKLIRRVFVAMKLILANSDHATEAQRLVESVENWDGWPQDFEVDLYRSGGDLRHGPKENIMDPNYQSSKYSSSSRPSSGQHVSSSSKRPQRPQRPQTEVLPSSIDKIWVPTQYLPNSMDKSQRPSTALSSKRPQPAATQYLPPSMDKSQRPSTSSSSKKPQVAATQYLPPSMDKSKKTQSYVPSVAAPLLKTAYDVQMAHRQTQIETMKPEERKKQKDWAQKQLTENAGVCVQGFQWIRWHGPYDNGGYRCKGGSHFVSDSLIAEGKGGYMGGSILSTIDRPIWNGPFYSQEEELKFYENSINTIPADLRKWDKFGSWR